MFLNGNFHGRKAGAKVSCCGHSCIQIPMRTMTQEAIASATRVA